MDRDEAIELERRGLEAFFRLLTHSAPTSRLLEFPGVIASAVPACPTRSFPNSVVYESVEETVYSCSRIGGQCSPSVAGLST